MHRPRFRLTENGGCLFWCPGCNEAHAVDSKWSIDTTDDLLTIVPSVRVQGPLDGKADGVCHSFITRNEIVFLSDSTHQLSGRKVQLSKWPF